jgi:ribonuclease J
MDKLTGFIKTITEGISGKDNTLKTKSIEEDKNKQSKTEVKKTVIKKSNTIKKPTTKIITKVINRTNNEKNTHTKKNIYNKQKVKEINVMRLKSERKKPTNPSKSIISKSISTNPEGRKQRPRPMLGSINRVQSQVQFPMYDKLPEGSPLRVIPLGGLNEVGKNSMAIEFEKEILIIDIGLQFPEENMPGIDYVIPDLEYVIKRKENIKGLLITHGHLDHIGAIHHYIEKIGFPKIYTTRLTKALIEKRLDEHDLKEKIEIITIDPSKPESKFQLGKFTIDYIRVSHSIPDAAGIHISTEAGSMFHTGDFKFDFTPLDGMQCDYKKLSKIAEDGLDLIFADSTNALLPGFCPSEKVVEQNLAKIFDECIGKRIIIATFGSSLGRHQAIISNAIKNGRKVFIGGRSMNENIKIAHDLNIISIPKSAIRKLDSRIKDYKPEEVLVLTTGSQGEPFAALSRISRDEHPHINISNEDVIVFSSSPIPGNERSLYSVIDAIYRKGASIITKKELDIHASGHAFQGDLKIMHSLTKPKYIIPIHGEYFMRIGHRNLAMKELGFKEQNVIMLENGRIIELRNGIARRSTENINSKLIFVDGKNHATITEKELKERLSMAEGGIVTILLELDTKTKNLKKEPRLFTEGFLENSSVNGVIIDFIKSRYSKLLSTYEEKITEKIIVKELGHELKLEILREVAREPMIQVIVTLK